MNTNSESDDLQELHDSTPSVFEEQLSGSNDQSPENNHRLHWKKSKPKEKGGDLMKIQQTGGRDSSKTKIAMDIPFFSFKHEPHKKKVWTTEQIIHEESEEEQKQDKAVQHPQKQLPLNQDLKWNSAYIEDMQFQPFPQQRFFSERKVKKEYLQKKQDPIHLPKGLSDKAIQCASWMEDKLIQTEEKETSEKEQQTQHPISKISRQESVSYHGVFNYEPIIQNYTERVEQLLKQYLQTDKKRDFGVQYCEKDWSNKKSVGKRGRPRKTIPSDPEPEFSFEMLKKKKNKNKKEKGDTSSYEPSIYDESEDEMLSKKKIKK